jgi:hypothetical protein
VDAFVRAITRNPGLSDKDSLVRWNSPICLLVAGLTAEEVKLVSARLSQISASSGAPLARSPCQPSRFYNLAFHDLDAAEIGTLNALLRRVFSNLSLRPD